MTRQTRQLNPEDRCFVCDAPLPGLTSACPKCGSVYRRGELVEERAPKPKQPAAPPRSTARYSKVGKCPTCGERGCPKINDPYHKTVESYQRAKTREEAIERMFEFYDKYPGRRRLPAREAFEVMQVRHAWPLGRGLEPALWIVYVRKRRSPAADDEPAPVADK